MQVLKSGVDSGRIRSLLDRRALPQEAEEKIRRAVEAILRRVRREGDTALVDYTKEFDQVKLTEQEIKVSEKEFQKACSAVDSSFISALRTAKENILRYHRRQVRQSWTAYEDRGIMRSEERR